MHLFFTYYFYIVGSLTFGHDHMIWGGGDFVACVGELACEYHVYGVYQGSCFMLINVN